MTKLTVKNPKWQARFDRINGWRELALVLGSIAFTAWAVYWFWTEIVL